MKKHFLRNIFYLTVTSIFFAFALLGYFDPLIDLLKSPDLTFTTGHTKISAYTIVKTIIAIIVIFWVSGLIIKFGENSIKRFDSINASTRELILKCLQIFVYVVGFLSGLDFLGIDLTTLKIFGGAFAIGIGFGLQKITSNFMSGLILLLERSVKIGDLIELSDGTTGNVRHTGARYTLVETGDSKEIIIPNEELIISKVINLTYSSNIARVDIEIPLTYGTDLELACKLITEAASQSSRCMLNPLPVCYLKSFEDNLIRTVLQFWIKDINLGRLNAKSEVMMLIWKKFQQHNINMIAPVINQEIKITNLKDIAN